MAYQYGRNPYIDKIIMGQNPSVGDFVQPFGNSPFTPGINPNAPDHRAMIPQGKPQGMFGKLDQFMGTPGGGFLMNLLAQSGYSTMPQSPFGAIGKAALMTQQQQRQSGMDDLQRQLIQSQIGLNNKNVETAGTVAAPKVQSAKTLDNGNIGLVMSDGRVLDTGTKEAGRGQILNVPGYGLIEYNPIDGSARVMGNEDIIREGAAERAGAERAAGTAAEESTRREFDVPQRVRAAETQIRSIDQTMEEVNRAIGLVSSKSTGPIGSLLENIPTTDAFALRQAIQPILAALSFDKLGEMRAASPSGGALGQVSERELQLLQDSLVSLNQAQSPGDMKRALTKVLTHYQNWKSVIEQDISQLKSGQKESVSGFRIVE